MGLAWLALAGPAAGQSAADRETARRLMSEGRSKRELGDARGALEAARAEMGLGLLVEAQDRLIRMLRRPAQADEPRPFAGAREQARATVDDLKARIPQVRLQLRGGGGREVEVKVDDERVPSAAVTQPRAVNPGHHVVTARVDGAIVARVELELAPRESKVVFLELPAPPSAAPSAAVSPVPSPDRPEPSRPAALRVLAIAGLAVTGVGLAVGGTAGAMSLARTGAARSGCNGARCPPSVYGDLDAAGTTATAADVGFAVAGIGLVSAAIGLFWPSGAQPVTVGAAGLGASF